MGADSILTNCLDRCRVKLEAWNKIEFRLVSQTIVELQEKLEWLERQPYSLESSNLMKTTRIDLNCWLEKEDEMWRQRSHINWMQSGDRNTRFFHEKASARYKKNYIEGMMDADGVWQEDEGKIEEIVVDYYNSLFKSNDPSEFTTILEAVTHKVSSDMNQNLTRDFIAMEVKMALKQMYPLKAPGPDGMPPLFFQHFWPKIGEEVTATVLDFLNSGISPPKFNETHIVLMPKCKEPKNITKYRPISLCNVVYKIASKTKLYTK